MKKIVSFILVFIFIFSVVGCDSLGKPTSKNDPVQNSSGNASSGEEVNSSDISADDDNTENSQNQSKPENSGKQPDNNGNNGNNSTVSGNSGVQGSGNNQGNNTLDKPNNSGNNGVGNGGGNTPQNNTSSKPSGTDDEDKNNNSDKENNDNNDKENDGTDDKNNQSDNSSVDSSKCKHDYIEKIVPPTCTQDGYTVFTCSKCKDSYKDEYVTAKHVFIDYICTECGIGDTDNAYLAVASWIKKNGTKSDNSFVQFYEYVITTDEGKYTFSFSSYLTVSFESADLNERMDIDIYSSEKCNVNYILNLKQSHAEITKKSVTLMDSSFTDKFTVPEGIDATEFKTKLCSRTNDVLIKFSENILNKKLNFTIDYLGFISEVSTLDEIKETEKT